MRHTCLLLILAIAVTGCSNPKPKAAPPSPSTPNPAAEPVNTGAASDIGDAEYNISCVVTIAEEHRTPQFSVQELKDYKRNLSMVTVDVAGAAPPELPVTCTLKSTADFPNTPVALQGRVFREVTPGQREEIGSFTAVAGSKAMQLPKREGADPAVWSFNVLKGLAAAPSSMLITTELTMLLTAPGTDEASLDPTLASVSSEFTTVEISNPVRINFAAATAAPAAQ